MARRTLGEARADLKRLVDGLTMPEPGQQFPRDEELIREWGTRLRRLPEAERERWIARHGRTYRYASGQERAPVDP